MIESIRASMRDRMWSIKDAAAFYGCGLTKAWKIVAQPDFPPRRPPMPNGDAVWSEREVREWAETRDGGVAELVDAADSKSAAARHLGSIPSAPTMQAGY